MKLNEQNYFSKEADMKYVSNSQIKSFNKCESAALAELKGEYESHKPDAFLVGSFVDVALTGTETELENFKTNHPEMYSTRGETKGHLLAKYKQAEVMIDRAKRDPFFMKAVSSCNQSIMTGELNGVPIKIKVDNLTSKAIVDLKTVESVHKVYYKEGQRVSFIENFDYITQGALYQEIVRQNTDKTLPFFLACVSKEEEPDLEVIQIENDKLEGRLDYLRQRVAEIKAIKDGVIEPTRCERCAYCRRTKVLSKAIRFESLEIGD